MPSSHEKQRSDAQPHATAAVAGVEIKVTVRGDQELKGIRAMELDEDTAEVRVVYFFDMPGLDLFNAGVVLRARLVKGDADDSTVKIRPVEPGRISQAWADTPGFKIEADQTGDRVVSSASLTVVQKRDEIDAVAKGKRPIRKLYSSEQERLLREFSPRPVDLSVLKVLGPIRALRWKTKHDRFPYELSSEEWRLPNGEDLLEVSIKAKPDQAVDARQAFMSHLRELGLDPEGAQETKTRVALEYFAKTLAAPA